ncbi:MULTISPECIES: polyhydroxyalkanoate depolymerase [Cohaesibacter]|uniref:polyhydroxyalkanoate depolymerase n=1 Tax=Cohaesibacter TaxID=655352 RepID=UPI0024786EC6|nr:MULTISPECIES: polyhydroxyalkanoate depolymerase [Cohaesibacter]
MKFDSFSFEGWFDPNNLDLQQFDPTRMMSGLPYMDYFDWQDHMELDMSMIPMPVYQLYEWHHAMLSPWRAAADATRIFMQNPVNPLSQTPWGKTMAAAAELFERTTRRYGKPEFGLFETSVDGQATSVHEKTVWRRPFCNLIHFERMLPAAHRPDPKVLIVAPLSGHYATLLRGTVETMLPGHDVYITDWIDARLVPAQEGDFGLDDYIEYIMGMIHYLGPNTHVMAVCQPSVPVLAAVSVMNEDNDHRAPASMTLMGGPIDTRITPTAVNDYAVSKGIDWFRKNVIMTVPFPHQGFGRRVYPGFLQLGGFMGMNLDRHVSAHQEFYNHLIVGDGDSAEKHRDFYDEYLAVMDMTEDFYLDTIKAVFIDHALPEGTFTYRGRTIDCAKITKTALMTVEGEKDDITGTGQTEAAQGLCSGLPDSMKVHYQQPDVGHYGVFNGSRFRAEIAPRIADFMRTHDLVLNKPK